jgi:hypothetical protein
MAAIVQIKGSVLPARLALVEPLEPKTAVERVLAPRAGTR